MAPTPKRICVGKLNEVSIVFDMYEIKIELITQADTNASGGFYQEGISI